MQVYIPKLAASPAETREEEEEEEEQEEMVIQMRRERVCIGKVPIMVKSQFCHLHGLSDEEAAKKGHCAFDAGGYFIIKGSEKVSAKLHSAY
jgi:DNA-directed RNA polymerase beta subunit